MFITQLAFPAGGKLTGRVTDRESGEALPGANMIVTHVMKDDGAEVPVDHPLGGIADADGYFFILNVPAGTYVVKASMLGYATVVQKFVRIESDRTITLNVALATADIEIDQVVVVAEREMIKKDIAGTQEIIVTTRMEQMPVLRMDEFVGRLKGVELVSGADGNGLSIRGGSIRETDVRLDGISLQDPRSENSYLAFNSTTVEEIQVLTGGFEAKYGGIRSGLLNVVTKDGNRERYTFSFKGDIAPANQRKFFGINPWSDESWIYRVYTGEYAMRGVESTDTLVPPEFRDFRGWNTRFRNGNPRMDSLQNLDLWKRQHPQYAFGTKPDTYLEGAVTGPLPGDFIPIFGAYAERTTFLFGFKYENSQLAFPLGPRDNYLDWNTQVKLTTAVSDNMRLSINGMYANIETVSGGRTTSYGGALVDQSSSFNFLNSTEASVRSQARLLGGSNDNLYQMFNKSRLQYYDQRYIVGGVKLTHTLSSTIFHTIDFQVGYTDQTLQPFSLDTNRADAWITYIGTDGKTYRYLNVPSGGSPNASTNPGTDYLNKFRLYGGLQRVDSSHTTMFQFKWDITAQLGRHHQVEAGIVARMQDLFVYTGTWSQTQLSYTPDLWQYFKGTPLDMGVYLQDKLEFEGMILNAGLRLDYFNPMKEGFLVESPPSEAYKEFYNTTYQNLPGAWGSYDRWLLYRDMLENPLNWPRTDNKVQIYLSPRMGVSFPVTEASKLYFNYGHFYQRPAISFLYNQAIFVGSTSVPTPDLLMAKTISYEFGYEQLFFSEILLNVTAYYKDARNEPLGRAFINYDHDNTVTRYFPDAYNDTRGVEIRLERPVGTFVTFQGMIQYMLQSYGQTGLSRVYENRLEAKDELRGANLSIPEPRPRANINLNLHTPKEFGPDLLGLYWFESIYLNFFFEWQDGGRILWNPTETDVKNFIYVDRVDYWNVDFRASKMFNLTVGSLELVLTVKNLMNNKWLIPENMTQTQYDTYKNSLRLPHQGGSDKWGQYKSDDRHINTGWWEAPIFLNPRRILVGFRVNF